MDPTIEGHILVKDKGIQVETQRFGQNIPYFAIWRLIIVNYLYNFNKPNDENYEPSYKVLIQYLSYFMP